MLKSWLLAVLILGIGLTVSHAQQMLPPNVVQELKAATVYVKTEVGPISFTGSGFVIRNEPDYALIVTNNHVIAKPKELEVNGFIPGLRGRDATNLRKLQTAMAPIQPKVSVVFNSGEPNELTVKAQVIAAAEDPDLAVLSIPTIPFKVKPFAYESTPTLTETMPLITLGFPFGETLSMNKRNPAVTVGKGSVSSVRKNELGRIAKVQIDGAINPGNSGGPVVDTNGKLLGIAVQTIQGSNIGLAIHPDELVGMMNGNLGPMKLVLQPNEGGKVTVQVVAMLNDPLKKLKGASVHFVLHPMPFQVGLENQPQIASAPGSRKLDLVPDGNHGYAKLPLVLSMGQTTEITVQGSYVDSQGKRIFTPPQLLKGIATPPPTPETTTAQKNNPSMPKNNTGQNLKVTQLDKRPIRIQRKPTKPTKPAASNNSATEGGFKPIGATNQKQVADNADDDDEAMDGEKEDSPAGDTAKIVWTANIKKMIGNVPNVELSGTLSGTPFTPEKIQIRQQRLTFRQSAGAIGEMELSLALGKKKDELSNQKCTVNGKTRPKDPHINLSIKREGDKSAKSHSYVEYLLVVEFGEYDDDTRTLPGKIYLCIPDQDQSVIAGTFEAQTD